LRNTILSISALILGVTGGAFAQAAVPTKVGIINIQAAIGSTKDGQKASAELTGKFAPTKARLEKKQADIEADKTTLSKGGNAMSAEQKEKLMRDIDQKTKSLNRDAEDAQAEVDQETGKIMQVLGERVMVVLRKYAQDKGYALILDVSNQQTSPVLVAADGIDVTADIIKLYDENSPSPAAASAPAATPTPAASRPAAVPSPAKKAPAPAAK
jgi:outer membrane protein